ncbi:MAG: hypothetical protein LBI28_14275 [Treponema sp.]|jgi:hypothetical protein|nr:hypothetical protein [Treponema sp.]
MRKYAIFFIFILISAMSAGAQTWKNTHVYIAPVVANTDQAAYFKENFTIETIGAGYEVVENAPEADYTIKLEVKPNMIRYDDGTEEPAPEGEKQYVLQINLIRNEDNAGIVAFSFAFDTTDEMYDYNLYLLYEAMANVPVNRMEGTVDDNRWRNKWIYIRTSFDYPITFYQLMDPMALWGDDPNNAGGKIWHNIDHRINPFPAVTIGLEFQYLNWMSTEVNFNLSFGDPFSNTFIPAIQIEQKFPIKPSKHFMIEPYAAVSFPLDTSSNNVKFPSLGVGGGIQIGVKGGSMGAFFMDVNYIRFIGDVLTKNNNQLYPNPSEIHYTRFIVGLSVGYKIGFADRRPR